MTTQAVTEHAALLERVAESYLQRRNNRAPVTRGQIQSLVKTIIERVEAQRADGREPFSFSKAIRGMCALRGTRVADTAEADAQYVRALATTGTPGQYLVPTIQANAIVSQLAEWSNVRKAGARIWPMAGVQTLNAPVGITAPSVLWNAQNSKQSPDTVANLGQLAFDLKPQTAFLLLPLQLFKTSVPAFDVILSDSFALACAESEDIALFATSQVANAPLPLMAAAITTLNCQSSANGGNIGYSDVIGMLLKASQLKMKPPFAWFCSPRTLYTRLLGLQDTTSRPLLIPDVTEGASGYELFGFPIWVTTSISETEVLGSGTNQSHLILCTPRAIHVAENHEVTMDVAMEFAFETAEVGLRIGHGVSFGYAPAAAIIALLGVN